MMAGGEPLLITLITGIIDVSQKKTIRESLFIYCAQLRYHLENTGKSDHTSLYSPDD